MELLRLNRCDLSPDAEKVLTSIIIKELKKKSEYVDWNIKEIEWNILDRSQKRLDGEKELREARYLCYDLPDMR